MYKYYLSLKYMFSRPINILATVGVVVAVWSMILVVGIFSGYITEVRHHIRGVAADLSLLTWDWNGSYPVVDKLLRADPAVAATAPRLVWYAMIYVDKGKHGHKIVSTGRPGQDQANFLQLLGLDFHREKKVTEAVSWLTSVKDPKMRANLSHPFRFETSDPDDPRAKLPGLLMSTDRAKEEGVVPGKIVTINTARQDPGEGLVQVQQKFVCSGTFQTRHFQFDHGTIIVGINDLARLFSKDATPGDMFSEVAIALKDPNMRDEAKRRLDAEARDGGFGAVFKWEDRQKIFLASVDHQRGLMKLVLYILLAIAAFLIYATLSMMVSEKRHDIGVLAALGATRRGVMTVFVLCGVAISVVGSLIGVGAAYYSCANLDPFNDWLKNTFSIELFRKDIYYLKHVPCSLEPLWIAQVCAGAILLSVVFSLIPAWRAARLDPAQTLSAR